MPFPSIHGIKRKAFALVASSVVIKVDVMKTTMKHTRDQRSKTKAITLAVADLNRRKRLIQLAARMGTFTAMMTRSDLRTMRGKD